VNASSIFEHTFDKLVISPGPNTPSEAGMLMQVIEAVHDKFPILGICLGHQALAQFYGARLKQALRPMHGKVSAITHNSEGIYKGLPNPLKVCRYHSLVIENNTSILETTASADNGECMSFRHASFPVTGIQYHPEAILTDHGLRILENWLGMIV
jgi:anthranilate synthase/aminodeoxychorismate synthase-like glutamine amidotransferase